MPTPRNASLRCGSASKRPLELLRRFFPAAELLQAHGQIEGRRPVRGLQLEELPVAVGRPPRTVRAGSGCAPGRSRPRRPSLHGRWRRRVRSSACGRLAVQVQGDGLGQGVRGAAPLRANAGRPAEAPHSGSRFDSPLLSFDSLESLGSPPLIQRAGVEIRAHPADEVVLMGELHPVHAGALTGVAEEAEAARLVRLSSRQKSTSWPSIEVEKPLAADRQLDAVRACCCASARGWGSPPSGPSRPPMTG